MKYLAPALAIAVGAFAIVAGGLDDAPGAQLLGAALIVGAIVFAVRSRRRNAA